MTDPIRVWTSAAYLPVYRCGGWACVRQRQGQLTGAAGGERQTTAARVALTGLAAALRDLPKLGAGAPVEHVEIRTNNPELAAFAAVLAGLGAAAPPVGPAEDLDLWAPILAAAAGRRLRLARVAADAGEPAAFTAAWADLARDKAKAAGAFAAPIPKSNLAKVPGLTPG